MVFKSKDKNKGKNDQPRDPEKDLTQEDGIKKLMDDLKTANEANATLSENYSVIEGKQQKAEGIIKALRNELKEMTAAMKNQGEDAPDAPGPEETHGQTAGEVPDALCATCKTKFNSGEALIKDQTSRTYLSLRCPQCGKIQNAEAAQARF